VIGVYKMIIDEVVQNLCFLTLHGSRAYGTSRPDSDWDVRGVAISSMDWHLGSRKWEQTQENHPRVKHLLGERFPSALEHPDPLDCEIRCLRKFVSLASDCNPNVLDVLFADPKDWIFATRPWINLYEERHRFLSLRVQHTYTGYAVSQLKRIVRHRGWLLNPPSKKPTREGFGLPPHKKLVNKELSDLVESLLSKKINEWRLDQWFESMPEEVRDSFREDLSAYFEMVHGRHMDGHKEHERYQASQAVGLPDHLFEEIERERRFPNAMKQWKQYQSWKKNRNPERAKLEEEFGYDSKHASHLVRLLLSAQEILSTGTLSVRHPYAELLKEVRSGEWEYDQLIEEAENHKEAIKELVRENPKNLPKSTDKYSIGMISTEIILEANGYVPMGSGLDEIFPYPNLAGIYPNLGGD